ncbi:MAG: hypothetical protein RI910_2209 [Verrucomicrobiota bacterium]
MLTTMLAYQGLRTHALPISSAAELLLAIAWGLSGLALFLDLTFTHRLPTWVIAGATTGCLVAAAFLGVVGQPTDHSDKPLIVIHVGAAVLAYCVLGAQALNSAAYLLQDRALARREFGGIYALLPALVPLDRIGGQLMGAAVWLLGLSLVIGATDWAQRDLALVALSSVVVIASPVRPTLAPRCSSSSPRSSPSISRSPPPDERTRPQSRGAQRHPSHRRPR